MIRWLARLTRKLGPSWLTKDELYVDGEYIETESRLLFTTEMLLDSRLDRLRTGILCRFPGNGTMPSDALQYAGRDRKIRRGPAEPQDVYELRLVGAIDKHRTRGNAWRMMEQLRAYCYPHDVRIRIWTDRGDVYTLERDGVTTELVRGTAWDWDGLYRTEPEPTTWSRFWVMIYVTTGSPTQPWQRLTWGMTGLNWGSGYTWGSTATPADVQAIRSIVETWKPDGTHCRYICIVFSDTAFDPSDPAPPLPDGTWGPWTKPSGTTQVPTRSTDAIYWPGTRGPSV